MATWDIPTPQGPHFTRTMPYDAIACPEMRIPTAFHVPLNGPLVRRIPQVQRQSAVERGLPTDFASLTRRSRVGTMLELVVQRIHMS